MREDVYHTKLVKRLDHTFPGCIIVRLDPRFVDFYIDGERYSQGVLDILVLYRGRVAALELKRARTAAKQANQEYFVQQFGDVCFAAFIFPENEEEVLNDLQQAFSSRRSARASQR